MGRFEGNEGVIVIAATNSPGRFLDLPCFAPLAVLTAG